MLYIYRILTYWAVTRAWVKPLACVWSKHRSLFLEMFSVMSWVTWQISTSAWLLTVCWWPLVVGDWLCKKVVGPYRISMEKFPSAAETVRDVVGPHRISMEKFTSAAETVRDIYHRRLSPHYKGPRCQSLWLTLMTETKGRYKSILSLVSLGKAQLRFLILLNHDF